MKLKSLVLTLGLLLSFGSFAQEWEASSCPTDLVPQVDNSYIAAGNPGWHSDFGTNYVAPPLTGKHFSNAIILYADENHYQVRCIYNLDEPYSLSVFMQLDLPITDIEQIHPENWGNGRCWQGKEAGIEKCSFKIKI